jgi:hypothetical protein
MDAGNLLLKLKLSGSRDKQVRQMVLLARSLRLTPQSQADPKTAGRARRRQADKGGSQPWQS